MNRCASQNENSKHTRLSCLAHQAFQESNTVFTCSLGGSGLQDIPWIGGSPVPAVPARQPHLRQRQLTQQRLFSWLPRTLAFKGEKKKKKPSVFPRAALLTSDSRVAKTAPAQRPARLGTWSVLACSQARTRPPSQSQGAFFLRLARTRTAWNPKVRVPSRAKCSLLRTKLPV